MKNAFYGITFLLFVLSALVHAGDKDHKFISCEKIYVQPNQIAICQEGIFIQHNDEWIATEAVHYDASGIFVTHVSDEWSRYWTCAKCGHNNSAWRNTCANCGYRPIK